MRRQGLLPSLTLCLLLVASPAWSDGEAGKPPAPAAPAPAAPATPTQDVLTLKDGRRLEGEIVGEDDRFVSLRSGGVTRSYAKDSVASVERASRALASGTQAGGPAESPPTVADPTGKKKKERPDRKDAPLSDAARSWLDALIARSAEADEVVRRSIGAAIGAIGPQAIPVVRAAEAAAADGPQKQFLGRLAADMEVRRDKRTREPGLPPGGMAPEGSMPGREPGGPEAGRAGGSRRPLEDMMKRLTDELELRDEQKPKVEEILKEALEKRFEVFRDARKDGLGPDEVAAKVEPLRTTLLSQMKPVLDEPQYAMFEEMAKKLFESQRGAMPGKPKAPEGHSGSPAPDQPK